MARRARKHGGPASPGAETAERRARPGERRLDAVWGAGVALVAVLVYANAFGHAFVMDDVSIIRDNLRIRSLSGVLDCFTTNYWGLRGDHGLYRPLTLVSYALNYAVSGLATWSYTAVNLALHAAVSLGLFVLVRSLGATALLAGTAGLLFATHPVHTEAVDGFVGRAELLSSLFFVLALVAHRRMPRTPGGRLLGGAAFLLALLSKENAITLPAVLLAMDWIVPARDAGGRPLPLRVRLLRDYPVYLGAALLYLGARAGVLAGVGLSTETISAVDNPMVPGRTASGGIGATATEAWLTPVAVLAEYLRLLVWPARLSPDYSWAQIPLVSSPLAPRFLVGCAALAGTVGGALALRRRAPLVAFGLAFVGLTFSVTSNLAFSIGTICAERLLYLPSAGFVLAVAAAALAAPRGLARSAGACLLLALCALGAGRTWARNPDWRDARSLWESAVAAAPGSAKTHANLGMVLRKDADRLRRERGMAEARPVYERTLHHLEAAIEIYPDYVEATNTLAIVSGDLGHFDEAFEYFRRATALAPDFPRTWLNWGVALSRQAAEARGRLARLEGRGAADEVAAARNRLAALAREALDKYDTAIRLHPSDAAAHYNRGVLYGGILDRPDLAAADFREVLRVEPDHPQRSQMERVIAAARGSQAPGARP